MRQGNGTDLPGISANDPRAASIGVIHVAPTDDRKSVLEAILTLEKLGRKQIAVELPTQNKVFQRLQDFDDLKTIRRKLQAELVFIVPPGPGPAELARQRRFPVYSTLESFADSLNQGAGAGAANKKGRLFGSPRVRNTRNVAGAGAAAAGGAIVGAEAA